MIKKEQFRTLVSELYPSVSFRQSCIQCSKDTGASLEYVYKMGMESSNNSVRRPFYYLLQLKKEIIRLKQLSKIRNSN